MTRGAVPRNIARMATKEKPLVCRVCFIPLVTKAEMKMGIHIWCVYEKSVARPQPMPRPRYGKSRV